MINNTLSKLRKKLSVRYEESIFAQDKRLSCGVVAFDEVMNGGLPEGKIVELFGDFSSGKSLLVYHAVAELQSIGGVACLNDMEDSLNFDWARSLNVDLDNLIYISPITTTEAVNIEYVFKQLDTFITEMTATEELRNTPAIFAWDSVAATVSAEEGSSSEYKQEMASRARVISQLMRKIPPRLSGTRIVFLLVNQLRDKPGVLYGATEDTPGGRAIKFHSHLRLKMRKKKKITTPDGVEGMSGVLTVEKSKVGRPFREVNFNMYFEGGIPKYSGLKDLLIREKIVTKEAAGWCKIGDFKFRNMDDEVWAKIRQERENASEESRGPRAGAEVVSDGGEVEAEG